MRDERSDEGDDSGPPRRKPSSPNSSSSSRNEFDFIERIRRQELRRLAANKNSSLITHHSSLINSSLIPHPSSLLLGIGDDAAVIRQRAGFDTVVTADLLVEGIDFRLDGFQTSARDLGHKALAVSLSDVAAMGARPRFCLLSVGVPSARWYGDFIKEFYRGVRALAARYGVAIIGGDISRTPARVVVDSVVLGEVRRGRAVLRSGALVGDQIFVTGSLGGAAAGLKILESHAVTQSDAKLTRQSTAKLTRQSTARLTRAQHQLAELTRAQQRLVRRQTRPAPRVEWGALVGERRLATAMIDLSDGLSSDLAHLCRESGVGARVEAALLPFEPLLKTTSANEDE